MIQVEQADASSGPVAESAQSTNPRTLLSDVRIVPESLNGSFSPAPTGIITLTDPAPPGGVMVDLASDQPGVVAVPGKPLIPEGAVATFFEPIISGTATATTALITATVGDESTSTKLHILPAAKEHLVSMQTHTDIGAPLANGTGAAAEGAGAAPGATAA